MKIGISTDGDFFAEYYEATVVSANDYYPFGSAMAGRKYNQGSYRFGFNGKEEDSEWGSQMIQDYGFRIYNPTIGKFLSVDPLTRSYPMLTPYQFASNTPIMAIDLDGLEAYILIWNAETPFEYAAHTRKEEIENQDGFDSKKSKVYIIHAADIGKLESQIEEVVNDSKKNGYGKTREVSFYGHNGNDGYVGETVASGEYNLADETGNVAWDNGQITKEGWKAIDFNFEEGNSIACFYGCRSVNFGADFLLLHPDVKYAITMDGDVGDSEEPDELSSNWVTMPWEDIYIMSASEIGIMVMENKPWISADYEDNPMEFNEVSIDIQNTLKVTDFSSNINLSDDGKLSEHKFKDDD